MIEMYCDNCKKNLLLDKHYIVVKRDNIHSRMSKLEEIEFEETHLCIDCYQIVMHLINTSNASERIKKILFKVLSY